MNELDGLLIKATSGVLGNPIENCIVIASDAGHFGLATNAADELASIRAENERLQRVVNEARKLIIHVEDYCHDDTSGEWVRNAQKWIFLAANPKEE